ncbi:MAG: hypothetical protein ABMA64_29950, partial [Myxococcota bacterium]
MLTLTLLGCPTPPPETTSTPTSSTGDTDTGPVVTDTGTPVELALSDVSARVHPQLGSLLIVSWTQSAQATVHVEYAFDPGDWR